MPLPLHAIAKVGPYYEPNRTIEVLIHRASDTQGKFVCTDVIGNIYELESSQLTLLWSKPPAVIPPDPATTP